MSAIASEIFSPEQISALLPDQRQQSKPATVRNKAQEIIESTDPIGEAFITNLLEGVNATPENVVAIDSRLKRLRHELRKKGASEEIINATLDDDITWESNKKQNADRKLHARIGISPSEHFSLESINARLQSYDTAKSPDIQALADVIVMLSKSTCLFGHEPSEICRESSPIPEECSHWKATRSISCKVCGKLTFSTSGRCLSHIRRRYDKL
ncbi:12719_t:CDS:2 [Entrophospora sp. SA101]|nr:12719_t:CDS:2 [Entrophospora sp. SA101]